MMNMAHFLVIVTGNFLIALAFSESPFLGLKVWDFIIANFYNYEL